MDVIARTQAKLRKLLPKNAFARGVSVLVGGTAGAQVLSVLAAPILTRLYSPEDYGLLAVYAGLLAIVGVVSSLRYELSIPLPEDDAEAANSAVLCLLLVGIATLLSAFVVGFLRTPISEALGVPELGKFLWLLPMGVLLAGVFQVFNYWAIRTKKFSTIAGTKIRQSLAAVAVQLGGHKLGGVSLLLGQVAGQSVGSVRLGINAFRSPAFKKVTYFGILQALRRYKNFLIFSTPAGFINTGGHQLPPVLFATLFSSTAAGFYALAYRILSLPATLLSGAISNVFFSHAAEAKRKGKLGPLYLALQDKLFQIVIPPAALFVIISPDFFSTVFGPEWVAAGNLARWLVFSVVASFIVSPLSRIFTITENQKIVLILQANLFAVRLISIIVGASLFDVGGTVALFSVSSLFGYCLYLIIMPRFVGVSALRFIVSLGTSMSVAAIALAPLLLLKYFFSHPVSYVVYVFAVSVIAGRYLFLTKKAYSVKFE